MAFVKVLLHSLLFLAVAKLSVSDSQNFKCQEGSTCGALAGYKPPNATTISYIQRFFGVKHLRSLLGANGLPLSTSPNYNVEADSVIKIPIPCMCYNGTGISNKMPIYTVQPEDGLYYIANYVFSGLVTNYEQIQIVNKIPNADLILVGQKLWIPIPCSCDEVDSAPAIHYAHVVEDGSTMEGIAQEFGTTNTTLFRINGIASDDELIGGNVIDVPLTACNSSVGRESLDYPLRVANGTYVFTANNCVRCTCSSDNNWTLQCEPSGLGQTSNRSSCPSMECSSTGEQNLSLGKAAATTGCTCSYAGFHSNQTISTVMASTTGSSCEDSNTPDEFSYGWRLRPWNQLLASLCCSVFMLFLVI